MNPLQQSEGHVYRGERVRGTVTVWVDGRVLDFRLSLAFVRHSPDGFNWGYSGSGPAQLAFALLIHALRGDHNTASEYYQDFKRDFVAGWGEAWRITQRAILSWVTDRIIAESGHDGDQEPEDAA